MTGMLRVKTKWTGFSGAPGYTNFYFRDFTGGGEPTAAQAQGAVDRTATFWSNIQGRLPSLVTLTIQGDVEVIEETNGEMTGVHNVTAPAPKVGENATSTFSGPTGAVINWRTAGVRNGRRVRGRTFIVPIATSCYQNDGTLATTEHAALNTAASMLAAQTGTPDLGVWARPTAPGASDGIWYAVQTATVPDLAAVLRSRRD